MYASCPSHTFYLNLQGCSSALRHIQITLFVGPQININWVKIESYEFAFSNAVSHWYDKQRFGEQMSSTYITLYIALTLTTIKSEDINMYYSSKFEEMSSIVIISKGKLRNTQVKYTITHKFFLEGTLLRVTSHGHCFIFFLGWKSCRDFFFL